MANHISPAQAEAISAALKGPYKTYAAICREVGVSRDAVVRRAEQLGMPLRAPGRPRTSPNSQLLTVETAEADYALTGSFRATGQNFGVSGERIAQLIGRRKDRLAA